tara:strand:- start:25132 stop:25653 length:522 start_codon:yes stop_codon:yes gene_type:complete
VTARIVTEEVKPLGVEGHWLSIHDGDARALAIFKRHYSYRHRAHGQLRGNATFVGQGEKVVLLTLDCRALFVWQLSTVTRYDGQEGVRCSVFRNEGPLLSSMLILEAEELAWQRWLGKRLFTYVWDAKVKSVNPGYCFKMAGWKTCGRNKDGRLTILEKWPPHGEGRYHGEEV